MLLLGESKLLPACLKVGEQDGSSFLTVFGAFQCLLWMADQFRNTGMTESLRILITDNIKKQAIPLYFCTGALRHREGRRPGQL